MSDERPIEHLFGELIELKTPEERQEYLDKVGRDYPSLRQQLEQLVAAHNRAGSFLQDDGCVEPTVEQIEGMKIGMQIGPYKLREQIGEGGMGVVYVAEQAEPLKRRVALKVIKPGMDSKAVIARFEAERNALALMNHPNIAQVLDAGTTQNGHPYFVMELVKGIPLTEYCDQHRLNIRDRLRLFNTVCQAIQHAHQKGIIHRDIKPNNVLVTELDGEPVAKVIDFGVAKALNQTLTEHSIYTSFQAVVGTPLYMSPEQASLSSVDVDTRSDVYSLGVLLYELLTGTTPFQLKELKQAAQDEILRFVREQEPPRPSNRISTLGETATRISQVRNTMPDQLGRQVKGDLDWIVMKALEKQRSRRYKTTDALVTDIERHLKNEPVDARPPSATYRFSRFFRRNRAVVMTTAGVLGLLLAAVIGTTSWLIQTRNAKQRETRALEKMEQAVDDLRNSVLCKLILEALEGNNNRVEEALGNARTLRIKTADANLLRAVLALTDGNYEKTARLAKAAEVGESDIQGAKRLGALSLQSIASFWSGTFDSHAGNWGELYSSSADTDIECLLQAYVLASSCPEKAMELLEDHPRVARTPFGFFIRTQVHHFKAINNHDYDQLKTVVHDFTTCRFLLNNCLESKRWVVQSHCAAIDLAEKFGSPEDIDHYLLETSNLVTDIESDPNSQYIAFWYYQSSGDKEKAYRAADQARRDRFCLFVAAWYLENESYSEALARFDRYLKKDLVESKHAILARAHLLAGTAEGRHEIIRSVTPLLKDPADLIRRHALAALCLACTPEQIKEYGSQALQIDDPTDPSGDESIWLGDSLLKFFAYPETADALLDKAAKAGRFAEANAHYMIGMYRLAEGRRDLALEHFEAVDETKARCSDSEIAHAYFMKMSGDETWPLLR